MTKPDDIPADVWAAADDALDNLLCNCIEASGSAEQLRIDSTVPIARAIMAERKRCAAICKSEARGARQQGMHREAAGADWCAVAIRKGSA